MCPSSSFVQLFIGLMDQNTPGVADLDLNEVCVPVISSLVISSHVVLKSASSAGKDVFSECPRTVSVHF